MQGLTCIIKCKPIDSLDIKHVTYHSHAPFKLWFINANICIHCMWSSCTTMHINIFFNNKEDFKHNGCHILWPFTSSLVVLNCISLWFTSINSRNVRQVHRYAHYCLISSVHWQLCHATINQTNHQAKFWKIVKPCLQGWVAHFHDRMLFVSWAPFVQMCMEFIYLYI